MFLNKGRFSILILSAVLILSACSVTEEDVMASADETFEAKMDATPGETNYENNYLSIYKPNHLSVEDEDLYNLVLTNDERHYLVFAGDVGHFETEEELLEAQRINGEPEYVKLYHSNGDRGYLIIQQVEDETYQVMAGYNSIKATSISPLEDVLNDAEMMFKMVQSVQTKE
ncbi:hypothetical protein [Alteribacter aurantiacus]|uniref:hypothetical protein n=1 Tax=Alteribacter aurantiacus TaxID=254410 RepID=UPI0003FE6EFB|nr:hypothetical protein [Alteribacter aurantiacus]